MVQLARLERKQFRSSFLKYLSYFTILFNDSILPPSPFAESRYSKCYQKTYCSWDIGYPLVTLRDLPALIVLKLFEANFKIPDPLSTSLIAIPTFSKFKLIFQGLDIFQFIFILLGLFTILVIIPTNDIYLQFMYAYIEDCQNAILAPIFLFAKPLKRYVKQAFKSRIP